MSAERFFLDTAYVQALLNVRDQYHRSAQVLFPRVRDADEVWVTEAVLTEVSNALARSHRAETVAFIERCYTTPNIRVVSVDTALFLRGVDFYRSRTDKEWGLTDCISFVVMQDNSLIAALTTDEHFQQAGFRIKANTLMGLRWVEGGFVRMGGAFWENSQRYMDNSPVFHLNRVSTPLLLLHGTADGLPITQSEEMYTGLLRLGKVAMLVRYHGEGHSPEMWSAENYQDCWRQIVNWFDRYVRYA